MKDQFENPKLGGNKKSKASEVYTIIAALKRAEEMMSLKKDWQPKNEVQKRLLKNFLQACRKDNVDEIEFDQHIS